MQYPGERYGDLAQGNTERMEMQTNARGVLASTMDSVPGYRLDMGSEELGEVKNDSHNSYG